MSTKAVHPAIALVSLTSFFSASAMMLGEVTATFHCVVSSKFMLLHLLAPTHTVLVFLPVARIVFPDLGNVESYFDLFLTANIVCLSCREC